MYVVREIVHCKPGKVRQMMEKFQASRAMQRHGTRTASACSRMSTGEPFWTLVAEAKVEKIDDFFAMEQTLMANETLRETMADYHDLVEAAGVRSIESRAEVLSTMSRTRSREESGSVRPW